MTPTQETGLSGAQLRQAFSTAFDRLEQHRDTVNALNVFPVPDGDTGTNMSLTMRAAIQRCPDADHPTADDIAQAMAQGAFFGARGNSGVILSQFFKGFGQALQNRQTCSPNDLAQALDLAREAAYGAVGTPREGTMLTVIRRAAEDALDAPASPGVNGILETAYLSACHALKNTPEQLPVLKEAGVVDSGGLGIVIIIGGLLEALDPDRSQALTAQAGLETIINNSLASLGNDAQSPGEGYLHQTLENDWGYCTEFIITAQNLNLPQLRQHYETTARSTVVAGDPQNVRIHIHAEDPGPAISYAVAQGTVSNVKIESMDQQNAEWAAYHLDRSAPTPAPELAPRAELAVVAVAVGDGLTGLFTQSGCAHVIEGGQTMNPSVQQLIEGIRRAAAENTIFLPNNKNIILTAQQVAANDPAVHIVPTRSIPQGVAALLAYNPLSPLQENLTAMQETIPTVTTIEVTQAIRDTTIDGVTVTQGDYIALLDDQLVIAAPTPEQALQQTIQLANPEPDSILTIYCGAESNPDAAQTAIAALQTNNPNTQIDQLYGGQPHYPYLASIE